MFFGPEIGGGVSEGYEVLGGGGGRARGVSVEEDMLEGFSGEGLGARAESESFAAEVKGVAI